MDRKRIAEAMLATYPTVNALMAAETGGPLTAPDEFVVADDLWADPRWQPRTAELYNVYADGGRGGLNARGEKTHNPFWLHRNLPNAVPLSNDVLLHVYDRAR